MDTSQSFAICQSCALGPRAEIPDGPRFRCHKSRGGGRLWYPYVGTGTSTAGVFTLLGVKITSEPNVQASVELGRDAVAIDEAPATMQLRGSVRFYVAFKYEYSNPIQAFHAGRLPRACSTMRDVR